MRISDWSSDVCSSDLAQTIGRPDRPCREIRLRNGAGNKDSVRYRDGLNDLHAATTVAIASPPLADVTLSRWRLIAPVFPAFAACPALLSLRSCSTSSRSALNSATR